MKINEIKSIKTFGGYTKYFEYPSNLTKTQMRFSVFLPNQKIENAIIWLSGLTCTEDNFITKAGAQEHLKDSNTMIICPDTSPRGLDLPKEHDSYDFGSGAGFYINALTDGYKDHYKMYDYIKVEVVSILKNHFSVKNISIMGHSMGGHGALILGLKEKDLFKSVSAFSPIVNPIKSPWGLKAFKGYLGEEMIGAELYDATELISSGVKRDDTILIDQGKDDEFFEDNLLTENIVKVCNEHGQNLNLKYRDGYDHSYFYISSFIGEHIEFHLRALEG
ncbi:MAG: S-formylglutathione hydrolase [Bacteriovoracaceae bacterium]|jgi:S-formylglutathione hydrolase